MKTKGLTFNEAAAMEEGTKFKFPGYEYVYFDSGYLYGQGTLSVPANFTVFNTKFDILEDDADWNAAEQIKHFIAQVVPIKEKLSGTYSHTPETIGYEVTETRRGISVEDLKKCYDLLLERMALALSDEDTGDLRIPAKDVSQYNQRLINPRVVLERLEEVCDSTFGDLE